MQKLAIVETQANHSSFSHAIRLVTLTNSHGLTVTLSALGASIWSMTIPAKDKAAAPIDVVLNYQDLSNWLTNPNYFGITAGRVANRIGGASFELAGKTITLAKNEGNNQLHGGPGGISTCMWEFKTEQDENSVAVIYQLRSVDGDQGFPGNIDIELEYRLNENNELSLTYKAVADQTTPICLTNHAYWNIAGTSTTDALGLELQIHADKIIALDEEHIPNGEFINVAGSAFDFNQAKTVGKDIQQLDNGYDHFYIANRENDQSLMKVATLHDPVSERTMEILTTELGVQFYSGNFLDGSLMGTQGKALTKFNGLCLETHGYPNAVNHPHFPTIIVEKGDCYQQKTVHRFLNF
ncbi:MAG: galactose mutarotase [Colwellia sp.]